MLALLLIIFLAVLPKALHDQNGWNWLPWFPAGGVGENDLGQQVEQHLVLPALTLAIPQIALISPVHNTIRN